jgi:tetratricopeptide (TPR) repeat protein
MRALNTLGVCAISEQDYDRAGVFLERQAELARKHGPDRALGAALINLSFVAEARGDMVAATRLGEEALAICRKIADPYLIGTSLLRLGLLLVLEQEQGAGEALEEGVRIMLQVENWEGVGEALVLFAVLAVKRRAYGTAATLLAAADALLAEVGASLMDLGWKERAYEDVRGALDDAAFRAALSTGSAMEGREAVEYALASID